MYKRQATLRGLIFGRARYAAATKSKLKKGRKVTSYDVVIIGAGNAALTSALAARENGASVLILEKAPEHEKGGNSYFTAGGFRFCYDNIEDVATDVLTDLSPAELDQIVLPKHDRQVFYDALMKVTKHQANEDMAWRLIDNSRPNYGMAAQSWHPIYTNVWPAVFYGRRKTPFLRRCKHRSGWRRLRFS